MLASDFELLLQRALHTPQPDLFDKPVPVIFKNFDQAESRVRQGGPINNELHFAFEKIRLGVAMALMQIFTDLGGGEISEKILLVLKNAAKANSISQIDAIIQKENKAFEKLFQDLYTNTEGELILDLFARTLEADSRRGIEQIVKETLQALEHLEFPDEEDDQ